MKLWNKYTLTDSSASLVLFFVMILFQVVFAIISNKFSYGFGVEYGNIATSMIDGQGFSNPFYPSITGPTAWMPPLMVILIYTGFKLFASPVITFIILSFFKFLSYTLAFYFLLKTFKIAEIKINYILFLLVFISYFAFSPSDNLGNIHDFWVPTLLSSLFIYSLVKYYKTDQKISFLMVVILFVAPFVSPIISLTYMVVLGLAIIVLPIISALVNKTDPSKSMPNKKDFINILTITLVFMFSLSIWTTRNYIVFNKFIPSKSNMWFEFYLSNIVDTDGQLSQSTLYNAHPTYYEGLRNEMNREGEIVWLEKFHEKSLHYLDQNFRDYISKVLFRSFNAFVFIENDMDKITSHGFQDFPESDQLKLSKSKLVYMGFWTSLYYSDTEIIDKFAELELKDNDVIFDDWKNAKLEYRHNKFSIANLVRSIAMALLPSLCILILLFRKKFRDNPIFIYSVLLYLLYLVPYILISHQIRYQRPLFLLQVVLVYLLAVALFSKTKLMKKT